MKKTIVLVLFILFQQALAKPGDIDKLNENGLYKYTNHFQSVVEKNSEQTQELHRLFIKIVINALSEELHDQLKILTKLETSKYFINIPAQIGEHKGRNALLICYKNGDSKSLTILIDAGCDIFYKDPKTNESFISLIANDLKEWKSVSSQISNIINTNLSKYKQDDFFLNFMKSFSDKISNDCSTKISVLEKAQQNLHSKPNKLSTSKK